MTWIVDATPLIVLAKSDHLAVLTDHGEPAVVPTRVYEEVVETGLAEGYPDARRIERAVDAEELRVEDAPESDLYEDLASSRALSEADAAVLVLAAARDGVAVMDERAGRSTADAEGIETRGTAYVVLSGVKRGAYSTEEAKEVIDDLVDSGWYCSTDLYARILRKIEALDADID